MEDNFNLTEQSTIQNVVDYVRNSTSYETRQNRVTEIMNKVTSVIHRASKQYKLECKRDNRQSLDPEVIRELENTNAFSLNNSFHKYLLDNITAEAAIIYIMIKKIYYTMGVI